MSNELVEALVKAGCRRWTNGNYDRLYIDAETLGLECEYYKTGNIRYAEFNGEQISNARAHELEAAKTYFDVKANKVRSTNRALLEAATEFLRAIKGKEVC